MRSRRELGNKDDATDSGAVAEATDTVGNVRQRQPLTDQWFDQAGIGEPGELDVAVVDGLLVVSLVQPPVQTDNRIVLDESMIESRLRNRATREADDDDPSFEGNAFGGLQ